MAHIRNVKFDAETYENFKQMVGAGNVTNRLNELMAAFCAGCEETAEDIERQLDGLYRRRNEVDYQIQQREGKLQTIRAIQQQREAEEQEQQQQEGERQEQERMKCQNCGAIEATKWHDFKIGRICHACYMNSDGKQIGEWMKKGDARCDQEKNISA